MMTKVAAGSRPSQGIVKARPLISGCFLASFAVGVFVLSVSFSAWTQSTIGTGSIQGTVTDQSGAVLAGARVMITNKSTAAVMHLTASSAGSYSSGPIQPGDYILRVEAKGFKTMSLPVTVQVGNTATGNLQMELGQESQIVEVQGSAVGINTEQATVQGTITLDQIENLPVNGRNFLDLAQLEPGVQIQEGSTFDPTKNGFSSISFEGRFGRTARIEVDGVDVSDETVGTTTQNIPASAIQEFQLSQSSLDLSTRTNFFRRGERDNPLWREHTCTARRLDSSAETRRQPRCPAPRLRHSSANSLAAIWEVQSSKTSCSGFSTANAPSKT